MKLTYFILLPFFFLTVSTALAQQRPLSNVPTTHPRIFLMKGEEKNIKKKIDSDEFLASVHRTILRKSNEFLTKPLLKADLEGDRMLSVSRTALTYIYYLSYSWRMTGDQRYAERAKKELQNVCSFNSWHPAHFLDDAEMTTAVSIGYDWLYDYLDSKTRATIENAIIEKGLNESIPETSGAPENYSWLKKKNNWNSVCNASMAIGALAIYHLKPELANKIINRSIDLVKDVAMHEYLPDGNYPEGYTYWNYGTTYNLFLINVLEKIYGTSFGLAEHSGFRSTPEYILQMSTQDLGCFAYSDCFSGYTFSFPMFWFAGKSGDHSMLWGEAAKWEYMKKQNRNDDEIFNVRYLPSVMMWAPPQPFSQMQKPGKRLYVGQGTTPVAILRNHWGGDDEIFVGLKGGSCLTNHSHMDIGSFVMYKGKNQWVKDLGAQDYYSLEKYGFELGDRSQNSDRWDALKLSSKIHNVMMFNGAKQNVNGKAWIDTYGDRADFVYATSNLTSIDTLRVAKHNRGVSIVDNSYVVIRDEITNTKKYTDVRWAMLTPADVKIVDDHNAELTMNGEKMLMKVEGGNVKIKTWPTASDYTFDEDNGKTIMIGFTSVLEPDQSVAFTVYLIPENSKIRKETVAPLSQWK
jgi:hypothetical protein